MILHRIAITLALEAMGLNTLYRAHKNYVSTSLSAPASFSSFRGTLVTCHQCEPKMRETADPEMLLIQAIKEVQFWAKQFVFILYMLRN